MSIVEAVLHRRKQERQAYAVRPAPAPSISAFFILPSAFPAQTPALSHSPLIGRQTCRSCRSLDGFWGGLGCYKHATPAELLCPSLILSVGGCPWQTPRIALRLRRESRMTLGCIRQRLQMGTKTYLSQRLYGQGRERRKKR